MGELDIDTALEWRGRTVADSHGETIGTLSEIYLDEDERPHWGAVRTGVLGRRETLVPLTEARQEGDVLRVPFEKAHVEDAPSVDPDVQLSEDEEATLFRHYGMASDIAGDDVGAVAAEARPDDSPA